MIELIYELNLATPAHVGTGYGFAGFLDSIVVRDAQGAVYVPGSSIKGKTRAAARRLADALGLAICAPSNPCGLVQGAPCPLCRLFGSPQFPGHLYFDNVQLPAAYRELLNWLSEEDPLAARQATTAQRTHVMLSRPRRAARPDNLFTEEVIQTDLLLSGRVTGDLPAATDALRKDLTLLRGALSLVTHIGRSRSRGLGRCAITVTSLTLDGASFTPDDYARTLLTMTGGSSR